MKSVGIAFWRITFVILLAAVFYFAWKPSPAIMQVPWMPAWLGNWFDRHDFVKNVIGFGVLALAGFMAWSRPATLAGKRRRWRDLRNSWDGKLFAGFCLLVVILELGQLALPRRVCDWADVLAGWLGITLAWGLYRARSLLPAGSGLANRVSKLKFFATAARRR